jgi:hypothetical protein
MEIQKNKEPKGRLLEVMNLENGLALHFYDASKPIAGDRFRVELVLYVPIDIEKDCFAGWDSPGESFDAFIVDFGKRVCFTKEKVRNFVDARELESSLEQMKDELLDAGLSYLSRPHFAAKYIRMQYNDWEKQRAWRAQYLKATGQSEDGQVS